MKILKFIRAGAAKIGNRVKGFFGSFGRGAGSAWGKVKNWVRSNPKKSIAIGAGVTAGIAALVMSMREEGVDPKIISWVEDAGNRLEGDRDNDRSVASCSRAAEELIRAVRLLAAAESSASVDDFNQFALNQRAADVLDALLKFSMSTPSSSGDFIASHLPLISAFCNTGIILEERMSSPLVSRTLHNAWEDNADTVEQDALQVLSILASGAPMVAVN